MSWNKHIKECPFCKKAGDTYCPAKGTDEDGLTWLCTREAGHEGDHVACAVMEGEHPIFTWPQKEE